MMAETLSRDREINGKTFHFWDGCEPIREGYMVLIDILTWKSPHMTYPFRAKVLKITKSGRIKLAYKTRDGELKEVWRSSVVMLSAERITK